MAAWGVLLLLCRCVNSQVQELASHFSSLGVGSTAAYIVGTLASEPGIGCM